MEYDPIDHAIRKNRQSAKELRERNKKLNSGKDPYLDDSKKYCTGCRSWKDRIEFGKNITTKDGLMYRCKKCRKDEQRTI